MKAVKMKDNIYWVGTIDWSLRNFHGYMTQRGSTYNAYLIIDEKITLVDTAKYYLVDELVERISSVIDPSKIDYIVANHVEMDHSGGLPRMMEIAPNATIITSPNGEKGLKLHYKKDWNFKTVNSGDSISIGKNKLDFVLTPMVHWPDNMVTYLPEEKILFSNDSFGQHIASSERFDDEYQLEVIMSEAKKYYANIVMPYGSQVQKELKDASSLDISMIAPSHGIIWRSHIPEIIEKYTKWSSNGSDDRAVIIYDSMWKSTEMIAWAVAAAFENRNMQFQIFDLKANHISDIMTEIQESKYICVGSPTLNNNMLPTVAAFLTYLKGLAPKDRKALAFGSYGWGGQSIKQINDIFQECKFELMDMIRINYIPTSEQLAKITSEIEAQL